MIDKRLISTLGKSKKYIAANVIFQWAGLVCNMAMIGLVVLLMESALARTLTPGRGLICFGALVILLFLRFFCTRASGKMSFLSSKEVKQTLREKIYRKLLSMGGSYTDHAATSEVIQMTVEGVDQLETYFGSYLPQFFYSMLAPLTLFLVLAFVDLPSAAVLLVCVPLIPVSIALVQTFAKKLLSKYWGQYTALGDSFLENLQGLTTLKIYQSDGYKHQRMNEEAEKFRKITMKVLTMQLNSITIMDLVAYGGAVLGMVMAVTGFRSGRVDFGGCLLIILLSADFFLPMRQLGSFFHIAMNGMAASDKIFKLLDAKEDKRGDEEIDPESTDIVCQNLSFSYEPERNILKDVNLEMKAGSFTALVGESGSGKSTVAGILMGRNRKYEGVVSIGGKDLSRIREESLMRTITYVSHNSYLFKGTVRENLLMGNADATDSMMWQVLQRVNLAEFLRGEQGLDTLVKEKASNLSGGQCQRLSMARALLHDSPVYIFDEATSNVDVESENDIMREIYRLAKEKTVILISHRLANVEGADRIYVLKEGSVAERGTHRELLEKKQIYARLWNAQEELTRYRWEGEKVESAS